MMSFARPAALLPALLALVGCVYSSHTVTLVPEVHGTLYRGTEALSNVDVLVSTSLDGRNRCSEPRKVAVTGANGGFIVPLETEQRSFYLAFAPPQQTLRVSTICFQRAGEAPMVGRQLFTWSHQTAPVFISCDVNRGASLSTSGVPQICSEPRTDSARRTDAVRDTDSARVQSPSR